MAPPSTSNLRKYPWEDNDGEKPEDLTPAEQALEEKRVRKERVDDAVATAPGPFRRHGHPPLGNEGLSPFGKEGNRDRDAHLDPGYARGISDVYKKAQAEALAKAALAAAELASELPASATKKASINVDAAGAPNVPSTSTPTTQPGVHSEADLEAARNLLGLRYGRDAAVAAGASEPEINAHTEDAAQSSQQMQRGGEAAAPGNRSQSLTEEDIEAANTLLKLRAEADRILSGQANATGAITAIGLGITMPTATIIDTAAVHAPTATLQAANANALTATIGPATVNAPTNAAGTTAKTSDKPRRKPWSKKRESDKPTEDRAGGSRYQLRDSTKRKASPESSTEDANPAPPAKRTKRARTTTAPSSDDNEDSPPQKKRTIRATSNTGSTGSGGDTTVTEIAPGPDTEQTEPSKSRKRRRDDDSKPEASADLPAKKKRKHGSRQANFSDEEHAWLLKYFESSDNRRGVQGGDWSHLEDEFNAEFVGRQMPTSKSKYAKSLPRTARDTDNLRAYITRHKEVNDAMQAPVKEPKVQRLKITMKNF